MNDARDEFALPAERWVRTVDEHRIVTSDAREDVRRLLHDVKGELADDCWKLDGPHLDGRFPVEEPVHDGPVDVGVGVGMAAPTAAEFAAG